MKLKNLPKIERPREKLISKGAQNLKAESRSEPRLPRFYYWE
jgi:hypothetical protein